MVNIEELKLSIVEFLGRENGKKVNLCLEGHLEVHKQGFIVFGSKTLYRSEEDVRADYKGLLARTINPVHILEIRKNDAGYIETREYQVQSDISEGRWEII